MLPEKRDHIQQPSFMRIGWEEGPLRSLWRSRAPHLYGSKRLEVPNLCFLGDPEAEVEESSSGLRHGGSSRAAGGAVTEAGAAGERQPRSRARSGTQRRLIRIKMTTSQKHRDFVAEPMGEKPVGSLAGIGEVLGKKLEERGFDKAYVVLGQFLVLKKDEDLFREWLKDTCGANAKQSRDCFGCLREWCDAFL